jgi:acetolactate synthase-1/2/3 large subunit
MFRSRNLPTGADLLVECLARRGVRHAFGMPGSHSTAIYDAIHRRGGIETILCRNEQAGAYMTDGYARATGQPGVVCTTAGPGATNALTGVAEAYADSVPVLLITGQVNHDRLHEECGHYHELDLEGVFRPCTRFAGTVTSNRQIPGLVDRAFAAMLAGRPGPAALILPQDLMALPAGDIPLGSLHLPQPVAPDPAAIRQAVEILAGSRRPIILAGGGAVNCSREVRELAAELDCPVITTLNGKGVVDERDPASLGHARSHRAKAALPHADAMLAVGCRFTEVLTWFGAMPVPPALVQIDIDPAQVGVNYPVAIGIVADAGTALLALLEELPQRQSDWGEVWAKARTAKPPQPEWFIDTLRAELPEDGLVFTDASEMALRMQTDFPAYAPRTFFYPSNYIALGWGFPAALGAAVALPDRPVVSVSGDGGFLMTAQELATAVRYRLKVVAVVHNDSAYGAIRNLQRVKHEGRYRDTDLNNPDFVKFGESFGVPSTPAHDAGTFAAALREALRRDGPSLIEVPDQWRSLRV